MAHFARLDDNNIVTQVIVVNNDVIVDDADVEQESIGIAFCQSLLGGNWVQTSYNATFRKNYAGIGFTYNKAIDAFVPPQPFPSWTLDVTTARYTPPVPYPTGGPFSAWNEATQTWDAA